MRSQQRARSEEQKEERRIQILKSAKELFKLMPYDQINMSDIAKHIRLTKGTIYIYFKTKEELFLSLFNQESDHFFDCLEQGLTEKKGYWEIDEFAQFNVRTIHQHPIFLRLLSIVHVILEHNISYDTALDFKRKLTNRVLFAGKLIDTQLPFLEEGDGALLLHKIYQLIIGCQQTSEPSSIIKEVLLRPEFQIFKIEFVDEFYDLLRVYLKGLEVEKTERSIVDDK